MDRDALALLEEALSSSPDNWKLRLQIARGYFALPDYESAKEHFATLAQNQSDPEFKLMLARCYQHSGKLDTALVICESLIESRPDISVMDLHVELLIEDGQLEDAHAKYVQYQEMAPGWRNEALEEKLKIPAVIFESDDLFDDDFLTTSDINFSDVGGMDNVKEEIEMKIILPMREPEMFKAYGKKAGGGILLFGPPGCGKTYLSRATAGEIDAKFLSIGIEDILDMWVGNSERNLHAKFEMARTNKPCVMFFDEVDALGSKRNDLKQSAGRNMINQFLKEMDGIDSDNEGVLILAATNSPWHMDSAFLRPGRFDRVIFVPPPDRDARKTIVELLLADKPTRKIDSDKLADKTAQFSGADIGLMIDMAVEVKLREALKTKKVDPLSTKDLLKQIGRVRPSTKEWFTTARNYALYSNASGMYDDVLTYLKL